MNNDRAITEKTAGAAPFSNPALLIGFLAFMLALFPFIGSELVAFSFMLVFLIVPLLAVVLGIVAVFLAYLSKRSRFKADSGLSQSSAKLKGSGKATTGLVMGFLAIMLGIFVSAAFAYFSKSMKSVPELPLGQINIRYYGEEDYDDIAVKSIMLSDSTLLTRGHRIPSDKSSSSSINVLFKSGMDGDVIWERTSDGSKYKVIQSTPEEILCCNTIDKTPTDNSPTFLNITRLSLDGDSLSSISYPLGNEASVAEIVRLNDDNFLIAGTYHLDIEGLGGVSYAVKIDSRGDSLWMKRYLKTQTGHIACMVQLEDDNIVIAGFKENQEDDKYEMYLVQADQNGNIILDNRDKETIHAVPADIYFKADTITILGNQWDEMNTTRGMLVKLSTDFDLLKSTVFSGEGYCMATCFEPIRGGKWLVAGWVPRRESMMKMTTQSIMNWDTYYFAFLNSNGERLYSFTGMREQFQAWGMTKIKDNEFIVTGFGGRGKTDKYGELLNVDMGLIDYVIDYDDLEQSVLPTE